MQDRRSLLGEGVGGEEREGGEQGLVEHIGGDLGGASDTGPVQKVFASLMDGSECHEGTWFGRATRLTALDNELGRRVLVQLY
ncbi:MAG: hypothetical protein JNL62_24855 [Bryobacterales bacterium]|nr:hypothetical protein [Bryobacterales bacterium]